MINDVKANVLIVPFPAVDRYEKARLGWTPALPGGRAIGMLIDAAPVVSKGWKLSPIPVIEASPDGRLSVCGVTALLLKTMNLHMLQFHESHSVVNPLVHRMLVSLPFFHAA